MQNISFVFLYFFGPVDFWFRPVKLQKIEFYWPDWASEKNASVGHCWRTLVYYIYIF